MVFLHPDDFKTLAGEALVGGMGDGRALYAEANKGLIFMVAESELVVVGKAAFDPVQRSSIKISLNERVSLTPVLAAGESCLRSVTFSVDLPIASQRDALPIESSDLADVIQSSLRGGVLAVQQYVLIIIRGVRLRLRVVNLETSDLDASVGATSGGSLSVLGAATRVQCRTYGNSPVVLRNAGSMPPEERGENGAGSAAGGGAGAASVKKAFAQVV